MEQMQTHCGGCGGCVGEEQGGCCTQACAGGCCGSSGCCGGQVPREITLTRRQADFLSRFAQYPFLPLARFRSPAGELSAVYLERGDETPEELLRTAAILEALAQKGLITLDYDMPLANYDYRLYLDFPPPGFSQTGVAEADKPETGSMAVTELGLTVLDILARTGG